MKKILVFFVFPMIIFASTGGKDYDILPRTINFLIFAGILFYLIKNPIKNFYNNRISSISSKLEEIQKKLFESRNQKLEVIKRIEDFKQKADQSIQDAHKEAKLLTQKIMQDTQNELIIMENSFEEQKSSELRKAQKQIINQVLLELFKDYSSNIKQEDIIKLIYKKVS